MGGNRIRTPSRSPTPSDATGETPSSVASGDNTGAAQGDKTAFLLNSVQAQAAMIERMVKLMPLQLAKPGVYPADPPVAPVVDPMAILRAADPRSEYPHYMPTPWDIRTHYRIQDGIRAALPKKLVDVAKEYAAHRSANPWFVNLAHTTPTGFLALQENDAKFQNTKEANARDRGVTAAGPSASPLMDASARTAVPLWEKAKLVDYVQASLNHTLMLHTLVNPAFTAPSLVALLQIINIAHGEHPSDWPHGVRILDGEMKNPTDPSLWISQQATNAASARRLGMDAEKVAKDGAQAAVFRAAPEGPALPPPPRPVPAAITCCYNWNHGMKCADGANCQYLHRCTACGENHALDRCRRRDHRDDNRRDGNRYRHGR